ncbi:MAG TPA: ABC transporter substrate-binding protein [Gemmataceae bacterium]|nr:ABC transporter substrate-binding protein [Gemmataceae bacterium]
MAIVQAGSPRRPLLVGAVGLLAGLSLLLMGGCRGSNDNTAEGHGPIKISYIGLTCEPPIFVAYEKGFFKEEGLDVELVKTSWDELKEGLGMGRFDATHHLVMYLVKPIENGLDIKITGGIHTGCLKVQVGVNSNIKKVEDLKGKKIGVPVLGSPPFLFASRVLAAHGLDPQKDVTWVRYAPDAMELALKNGEIEVVADAEPIGTILQAHGAARTLVDQALDAPYKDEFCCAVVVSGQFYRRNPEGAAKVTKALIKGAKWVQENKMAAAKLAVEKHYLAATPELNAQAIRNLQYVPSISKCRQNIDQIAEEMKKAGFLKKSTKPEALAKAAWADLPGVTDDWIQSVKVEKVPGGGNPPALDALAYGNLFRVRLTAARPRSCCSPGSCCAP